MRAAGWSAFVLRWVVGLLHLNFAMAYALAIVFALIIALLMLRDEEHS
jgi:hypothetical protein